MNKFQLDRLDHLVLTVNDLSATLTFYTHVLGMQEITFGENRKALQFGSQKINLHQAGSEFEPKAAYPTPGSADLCFITSTRLDEVIAHLNMLHVGIVEVPAQRTGAVNRLLSIYLRDPDGNLIEVSNIL